MSILSKRINNLAESETLAMSQRSRDLKEQGINVINLSVGEPDFNTPEYIKKAAHEAIDGNYTHYSPVSGYADLRKVICNKLERDNGLKYEVNEIVVSTGAKQALANVVQCLVNEDEEVIVPAPYWVSYKEFVKLANAKAVYVNTTLEQDFKITPEQLEAAITPKSKLFIFSSPCNPTGSVYSKDELRGLADVFLKHPEIFIVSDEIYELINFGGKHVSIASFPELKDRVIVINGVSKGFAMTGWRVGYSASTREIAQACEKLQGQVTSGTCGIAQRAAYAALQLDPADCFELQDMVDAFRRRRDMFRELLLQIPGFNTNNPQGAFYFMVKIDAFLNKTYKDRVIRNAGDFSNFLLDVAHVATVPGDAFGMPGFVRLSYATSEKNLETAAANITEAVKLLE